MNKRGKFYVPLICAVMILLLIASYFELKSFYNRYNDLSMTENIGSKQAAVMQAVREGERMQLYVQEVAKHVQLEANSVVTCGDEYLGLKILGRGDCSSIDPATDYPSLNTLLAQYPGGSLADIIWVQKTDTDAQSTSAKLVGSKKIPVGTFTLPTGTFSGGIAGWPTDYKEISSAGSLFGQRTVRREGIDSTNHPGLDFTTKGNVGEKIYSLTDGEATFIAAGENSYVRVVSDKIIVDYQHVQPTDISGAVRVPSGNKVHVTAGNIIAVTAPHGNAPHLHLQIQVPGITKTQVEHLWPGKTGNRFASTEKTYAVTTDSENRVLLDPVCFFNRTSITEALQKNNLVQSDTFEACNHYGADLGLNAKFSPPQAGEAPAPQSATNQNTASQSAPVQPASAQPSAADTQTITPKTTLPQVQTTKDNLDRQRLYPDIKAAAEAEGIDPKLILAIMTQESKGEPDAVSATGCAGIGQFCSATAKGYPDIFPRITPCNCEGAACKNPSSRACNTDNDDRFDAKKSIRAMAKLHKANWDHFQGKDQQAAFAIAAYNGGWCPVDHALEALQSTNANPSWPQVKDALLALDETRVCVDARTGRQMDKKQITDYVDFVLKWYDAWGGQTFAGTLYTGKQYGYYDVRFEIPNITPSPFDALITQLQDNINSCTDHQCIEQTIRQASTGTVVITEEQLSGSQGCLAPAQRALLDFANKVQWCKGAPDAACSCPVSFPADAVYRITAGESAIGLYQGKKVTLEALPGLSVENLGEGNQDDSVRYFGNDDELSSGRQVYVYNNTLTFSSGEAPATIDDKEFVSLRKEEHGFAFEKQSGEYCMLPVQPKAYCIKDANNPQVNAVFFVDMAAHSTPSAHMQVQARTENQVLGSTFTTIRFTTDHDYPFVRVSVISVQGDRRDIYVRVHALSDSGTEEMLAANVGAGVYGVLKTATEYVTILPADSQDTIEVRFLDENLRETAPLVLQGQFAPSQEQSGFPLIPTQ